MKSSFICDTQPLSKMIKNQKLFRVGMFYVELNPGEDADEEDVISQSIKEIHQVLALDQNSKKCNDKNLLWKRLKNQSSECPETERQYRAAVQ